MKFDLFILSTNEYLCQDIFGKESPEKYLYDAKGECSCAPAIFNAEAAIAWLINFLFQGSQPVTGVYRNKSTYILDLFLRKALLIEVDYQDEYYPKWIGDTGRENSMNESGMLIDFCRIRQEEYNKKYLLMIVSTKRCTG